MAVTFLKKDFPYSHWQIIEVDTGDYVCIVPERGGLITEWYCNGREILYFDLERYLQLILYRGLLFPYFYKFF